MDLETAQHIIEQEALPILLAKPSLQFDIKDGSSLSYLFRQSNKSLVVTEHMSYSVDCCLGGVLTHHIFNIEHPVHGIGCYKTICYKDMGEEPVYKAMIRS